MNTLITNGIKISVVPSYHQEHSDPTKFKYIFSYHISIENKSPHTVQLLRRTWIIFDSNGSRRRIEGEGVIGKKPILKPGQSHQYTSWCPLISPIGKMNGHYLMERTDTQSQFKVIIPDFHLIVPALQN